MEKAPHPSLLDETADMPMWTIHEGSQLACFNYLCASPVSHATENEIFWDNVVFPFPFRTEPVWHVAWYTRLFVSNIKGNKEENSFLLWPESLRSGCSLQAGAPDSLQMTSTFGLGSRIPNAAHAALHWKDTWEKTAIPVESFVDDLSCSYSHVVVL